MSSYLVIAEGRIETEHATYEEAMEAAHTIAAEMRSNAESNGEWSDDDWIRVVKVCAEWKLEECDQAEDEVVDLRLTEYPR